MFSKQKKKREKERKERKDRKKEKRKRNIKVKIFNYMILKKYFSSRVLHLFNIDFE